MTRQPKSMVPKVRFKGFTDEWEQRKFGEIYDKIRNAFVGTATPYYVNQGHFYLESNNVKYGKLNFNNEVYINDDFYQKQKPNWLHTGDLVVVQSGHVGHSAVIPSELNNTAAHAVIIVAKPKQKIDSYFINDYLQTNIARKQIDNIATGNTIKHILASAMKMFEVSLPSYEEQRPISNLLAQIDDTITLQQRKLDQLNTLKKGLLQKMFADKKHPKPELRFKGFSGNWEQRKLKESCSAFLDGDWIESKNQSSMGVRLIQTGNIGINNFINKNDNKKWISLSTFEKLKCTEVLPGDILISRLPDPAGRACIVPSFPYKLITAVDCTIVRTKEEYNPHFLVQYLSTFNYFKQVKTALAGGTRQRVSRKNLEQVIVEFPTIKEEQNRIAKLLSKIDSIITLQQSKLDKLNSLKKSLLQNMFI